MSDRGLAIDPNMGKLDKRVDKSKAKSFKPDKKRRKHDKAEFSDKGSAFGRRH
jgi:hypothetical protein